MPIRAKLVHSVTLIAQPRNKHPMLKTGALKLGDYEIKNRGTFGLLWFTDFGEKFIRAIDVRTKKTVGKEHKLKHLDILEIVANK